MKLILSVRDMRDLMLASAGKDKVSKVNTVLLEDIMDRDTSIVNRIRKGVSKSLATTANRVAPK